MVKVISTQRWKAQYLADVVVKMVHDLTGQFCCFLLQMCAAVRMRAWESTQSVAVEL